MSARPPLAQEWAVVTPVAAWGWGAAMAAKVNRKAAMGAATATAVAGEAAILAVHASE